ncbi:MAG: zinc transporter ZupT [Prevotellaceae bacterium]|jgi:ZIP family zinc transporter|nr:zinc transporter ZupT [Prevotellaceae bacterium]
MGIENAGTALALTLVAGLSTGVGSLIALLAKRTNTRFLCASLGFSAGVMIYISFMEMMPAAQQELIQIYGRKSGMLYLIFGFFGGMGLITLIDFLIPESTNPHEMRGLEEMNRETTLRRTGFMVALSITLHNFPEGIATFTSALNGLDIAIPIAVAIAVHNIPEGIAVSVPIYHATGSRKKAFAYSFLSGLSEPLGAVIAYLFLMPCWSPTVGAITMSAVSGIMVFISLDELLPSARKYGEHHISISGLVFGMILMAMSLYLLQ